MHFVEIENLGFRYEDMEMRFDLALDAGEMLAILGPSGAGKSTLLALIAGFEEPFAGSIKVGGVDITGLPPAERPVTSLFQDHNLFTHLSVEQNVGLGLRPDLHLTVSDRQSVAWALQEVGLQGFEQRLPGQLSGGERQRVAIARCLLRKRPVLLLDEPFAALGPALRREMLRLVMELRDRLKLTILMVTHDPMDARLSAPRTVFVSDGRIVMAGPTNDILSADHAAVQAYLGG